MAQQLADARVRPFAKIVDVTTATAELAPEHIAHVAELLRGDGSEKRGPVAFIVDPQRGHFARAFAQQTASEGPINVFRSLHEARASLLRAQQTSGPALAAPADGVAAEDALGRPGPPRPHAARRALASRYAIACGCLT